MDNGKAKSKGSIIYHGYFSIKHLLAEQSLANSDSNGLRPVQKDESEETGQQTCP